MQLATAGKPVHGSERRRTPFITELLRRGTWLTELLEELLLTCTF